MRASFGAISSCLLLNTSARAFISKGTPPPRYFHSSRRLAMVLKEGDKLPMDATFQRLVDGKPTPVSAADLFAGKKVVICGVPGAMTPTCSESHVPTFINAIDDFKAKGVDTVAVISVNDPFVMSAWGKKLEVGDSIMMLGDGSAAFAKSTGLNMDTGDFGGVRLKRMAMLVNDGVVEKLGVEDGGGFTDISDAKSILAAL
ncbi:Peroxyredoxin [Tribonema minus]|uniref:Peroxyredoxin n=1 Tax=Tribonema minus TaxID=303371 RepID=A0A836CPD9_9STRA|nr:Peroxyredoxin [Tribonema minus]